VLDTSQNVRRGYWNDEIQQRFVGVLAIAAARRFGGCVRCDGDGSSKSKARSFDGSTISPQASPPRRASSGQVDTKGIADPFDKLKTGFGDFSDSGHQDTKSSGSG